LRRPDEVGLEYEDVTFPSMDGVPLEGWFVPADADRLTDQNQQICRIRRLSSSGF